MISRIAFVIVIAFSIGVAGALILRSMDLQDTRQSGKALIGGPFSLTNHKNEPVTEKTYQGKFMLVYFGYTFCPDICPAELQIVTEAMEKLGDAGKEVVPLFISIDPKRDTVEQMASYVSNFHPSMVGLTGTDDQIKQAAAAYHVFYARAEGEEYDEENYSMDHSTFIYLMSRNGEYLIHFPYGMTSDDISNSILKEINKIS